MVRNVCPTQHLLLQCIQVLDYSRYLVYIIGKQRESVGVAHALLASLVTASRPRVIIRDRFERSVLLEQWRATALCGKRAKSCIANCSEWIIIRSNIRKCRLSALKRLQFSARSRSIWCSSRYRLQIALLDSIQPGRHPVYRVNFLDMDCRRSRLFGRRSSIRRCIRASIYRSRILSNCK